MNYLTYQLIRDLLIISSLLISLYYPVKYRDCDMSYFMILLGLMTTLLIVIIL